MENFLFGLLLALLLTLLAFALFLLYRAYSFPRLVAKRFESLNQRERESGPPTGDKLIDEKRQRFLNIPSISFHYADKERITNFYNDYFREPTVENIVNEMSSEISGDLKGKLPSVLETKAGGRDLTKWIRTLKLPETSLNGMFLRYQRETIANSQVALGLEVLNVEMSMLESFERDLEQVQKTWGMNVPIHEVERRRNSLKQKAAEATVLKLEQATGWVLIEGIFQISEAGEGFYKCTYQHPVTEYMSAIHKNVSISLLLPRDSIEAAVKGNYQQSIGKAIPLRVYGEVWRPISREFDNWEFTVTPLAVY